MNNIPMFVTENGAASLTLEQIPYRGCAYVRLLDAMDPETMLQECSGFCRAAGACKVYAWGHPIIEKYPFFTSVLLFSGNRTDLPETEFTALPVTEEELDLWRRIYNEKMADVACAAYMTQQKAQRYCNEKSGYMVRDPEGDLCGIGTVEQDRIGAVISLYRGMGGDVLCALAKHNTQERIFLEVSSSNERAVRLYLHLGLECVEEISALHEII